MTTATHQALLCGELYHLICENCDIQTLSALSRTSRDLQETALDALWSEMPNLGPLVRCMPGDLWEQREDTVLSFRRVIRTIDWHRFQVNSARVRKFGGSSLGACQTRYYLDAESRQILFCAAQGMKMKLLPRVQEIVWEEEDRLYPYITLLLSQMTHRLGLNCSSSEKKVQSQRMGLSLLPAVPTSSPRITDPSLSGFLGVVAVSYDQVFPRK
ncbi:hypothetical protein F5887DRAFT_947237 [Amanita rubescens]|nr:hypothetical protein F5887DRAFT_947237 [Amanita rubescens]